MDLTYKDNGKVCANCGTNFYNFDPCCNDPVVQAVDLKTRELREVNELATLKQRLAEAEEVIRMVNTFDEWPSKIIDAAREYFNRKEGGELVNNKGDTKK